MQKSYIAKNTPMKHTIFKFATAACLLFATVCFAPNMVIAQGDTTTSMATEVNEFVQVTLNDGTLKYGRLLDINDSDVVISITGLGTTRIPKYLIQSMISLEVNEEEMEQGYVYVSNQPSRYFFAPSGIQLPRGEGYFQSNIALNSISYGFTDRFTGGIMISMVGAGVTAKFGRQVAENVHISAGGLAFVDYFGNLDRPLLLGFANVTFGDENKNLTFNVGVGNKFDDGQYYTGLSVDSTYTQSYQETWYWDYNYMYSTRHNEYQNPVLINVSGMLPLTQNRWFITENYLVIPAFRRSEAETLVPPYSRSYPLSNTSPRQWSDTGGGISIGIRSYNKRSGWLWDYGLAGVFTGGDGFPLPWFSFTLEF